MPKSKKFKFKKEVEEKEEIINKTDPYLEKDDKKGKNSKKEKDNKKDDDRSTTDLIKAIPSDRKSLQSDSPSLNGGFTSLAFGSKRLPFRERVLLFFVEESKSKNYTVPVKKVITSYFLNFISHSEIIQRKIALSTDAIKSLLALYQQCLSTHSLNATNEEALAQVCRELGFEDTQLGAVISELKTGFQRALLRQDLCALFERTVLDDIITPDTVPSTDNNGVVNEYDIYSVANTTNIISLLGMLNKLYSDIVVSRNAETIYSHITGRLTSNPLWNKFLSIQDTFFYSTSDEMITLKGELAYPLIAKAFGYASFTYENTNFYAVRQMKWEKDQSGLPVIPDLNLGTVGALVMELLGIRGNQSRNLRVVSLRDLMNDYLSVNNLPDNWSAPDYLDAALADKDEEAGERLFQLIFSHFLVENIANREVGSLFF